MTDARQARVLAARLLLTLLAGCSFRRGEEPPADAVIYARIITMEHTKPRAKGVAIRNGIIVKVASPQAIRPLVGRRTRIFNWRRWTLVPGFIDAHVDLLALGESMVGLDLRDSSGLEEISGRVRAVLAERGVGEERWIVGYSWEEHRFRDFLPVDRTLLDKVAPERPVLLHRADRRAVLTNSKALRLAGLDGKTPDPPGGRLVRNKDGSLTGLLHGTAVRLVARMVPRPSVEIRRALLKAALGRLVKAGFTTVHDMGGDGETWRVLLSLARSGDLPLRVYATIDGTDPMLTGLLAKGPQVGLANHYLTLRTVRIDLDGDLGSRMALLDEPYADAPGESGLAIHSLKDIMRVARQGYKAGFQIAIQARGDAATTKALNALERLLPGWAHWSRVRPRLEGVDLVNPDDASRFGLTHLIASVQPSRCARQLYWIVDRVSEDRERWAHPWRSLERGGAIIAFGTGAPELPPDPRTGFIVAVNREDETGWPPGGWKPMERLTAPESLRAFTLNAAYAAFEERLKGSIRAGKLADFTVLSRDILYTDPEDLDRVRVLGTIVGGMIRYRTRHLR